MSHARVTSMASITPIGFLSFASVENFEEGASYRARSDTCACVRRNRIDYVCAAGVPIK